MESLGEGEFRESGSEAAVLVSLDTHTHWRQRSLFERRMSTENPPQLRHRPGAHAHPRGSAP